MRTFTQNFKIMSVIVVLSLSAQGCYTYVPTMSREADGVYYNPRKDTERTEYLKNRYSAYQNSQEYSSSQSSYDYGEEEYSYEKVTPTEIAYWSTMPSEYRGTGTVEIVENPYISYCYYPTYTPSVNLSLGWNNYGGWSWGLGFSWGTPYYGWYDPWYYGYGYWYSPWYYGWYDPWYYGYRYDLWHYGWYDPWFYPHVHHHWYDGPGWGPGGHRPPGGIPHYNAPHRYNSTTVPNARRPISRDNDRNDRDDRNESTRTPSSGGNYRPDVNISQGGGGIIRSSGGYYRRVPVNDSREGQQNINPDGQKDNGSGSRPASSSPQQGSQYRPSSSPQGGTPTRVNTSSSSQGERSQYRNIRGKSSSNTSSYRPSSKSYTPNGVKTTSPSYESSSSGQNRSQYSPSRSSYSSSRSSGSSSSSSSGGYRRR